jgi:hypothetical protein
MPSTPGAALRLVNDVRRTEKGKGWRKPWVEFDGASQQARRFAVGVFGSPRAQFSPAQEAVIGFQIVGVLRCDALPVARAEIERESGDDQVRHVVLHGKDVCQISVESSEE